MAKLTVIAATWILTVAGPLVAQNPDRAPAGGTSPPCADGPREPEMRVPPSTSTIRISAVEFQSDTPLPAEAEKRLRRYMLGRAIADAPDWVDGFEERVKDAWQQFGYFAPEIQTSVRKVGQNPLERNFAVTFHVTAGRQYRLGDLRISGATMFAPEVVRSWFSLQEGDIFDTHSLQSALEASRKAYSLQGYINVVLVPSFQIDDSHDRISLFLEIDEGQQYRIGRVTIVNLNQDIAEKLIQDSGIKTGVVFSWKLIEDFIQKNRLLVNGTAAEDVERSLNNETKTVDLVFVAPAKEP